MKYWELDEWHAQKRREYLAIPVAERLAFARFSAKEYTEKVARLEAERDANCATSWLARRQLPMFRKKLAAAKETIEECLREIENQPKESSE